MKYNVDLIELIGRDTPLSKAARINGRGIEYQGPCPFCGGTDRFRVQPDMGLWWCRQCSESEHWSTAPDYVMRRDNVAFRDALKALGLSDPEPDAWDYHDAHGTVIYQVVRFEKDGEKRYFQRTPDGRGGWNKGLNGVATTLYRLPEVLRAAQAGETIYVAEGEKCADALRRLGLTATTNSGGAGKWRPPFGTHLTGASAVVVFEDNDQPGREHAANVAMSARRVVADTRIVRFTELPPGSDVVDWLSLGHTLDELLEYVATPTQDVISANDAPPTTLAQPVIGPVAPIDVNDLLAMERKPTLWYAPGFVREGLGLLVGQPNVGKTPAAIQLAIAIATGGKWLNQVQCHRAKVLYLGMEYSPQELIPMFDVSRCGQVIERDWLLVKTIEDDFPTTPEEAVAELEWYIREMGVQVIIIDVLTAFLPPEKFKQNIYRGDYSELKPYHRLALQYHVSILGVWHASKREADPKIMYNGSTGMWAAAASRMAMYTDSEQRVRIASFPRMGDKIDWALTQERHIAGRRWIVADANPDPVMGPQETTIYRWLKGNSDQANPRSPGAIAEMTGLSVPTVRTLLRRMFEKNIVHQPNGSSNYFVAATAATGETDVIPVIPVTGVIDVIPVTSQQIVTKTPMLRDISNIEIPHQDALNEGNNKNNTITPETENNTDENDIF